MENDFIKHITVEKNDTDSNDEYHEKIEYCGSSILKKFKRSPLHWREEVGVQTDAFTFGSAYHTYMLEPDKFNDQFWVFDDEKIVNELLEDGFSKPRATKKYKGWLYNYEMENDGKLRLSAEEMNRILMMSRRLLAHPYAKSLLSNGEAERSFYAEMETTVGIDVKCKARPDYLKEKKRIVVDLKTCQDASAEGFQKAAAKWDYHIAAALYLDIVEGYYKTGLPWSFIFIAQEKFPPYAFNIFEASPNFIGQGRYEYELLMMLVKQCETNGKYPGYQVWCDNKYGVNTLNLPVWAVNEINFYNHKF